MELAEPVGDEFGFVAFVVAADDGDGLAAFFGGVQRFVASVLVAFDERVGGLQNRGGGAEVLAQQDGLCAGEVFFEVEDVGDVSAAPAVDCLVGVADDADVGLGGGLILHAGHGRRGRGQQRGDAELDRVGVLVFVDHQVAPAAVELGADVFVLFEQLDGEEQQVIEVDGTRLAQRLLVAEVDLGDLLGVVVVGVGLVGLGVHEFVLGVGDGAEHGARRPVGRLQVHRLEHALHGAHLVAGVVDGVVGLEPGQLGTLGVAAQQAGAEGVEGGDGEPAQAWVRGSALFEGVGAGDLGDDALAHLAGGFVGEGQGEDAPGRRALLDDLCDAPGDDAGLARAGGGEDEQGALGVEDGGFLGVGEAVQYGIGRGVILAEFAREVVVGEEIGEVVEGHGGHRVVQFFEEVPSLAKGRRCGRNRWDVIVI